MATVDGRLKTFNNWPIICLRPRKMAEAGFFYTGNKDCVQCFKCCKSFYSWKEDNVPVLEHRRHNPDCSYIQRYGGKYQIN